MSTSTPFPSYVGLDDKMNTQYAYTMVQGGIGLPDRDYYLGTDARMADIREDSAASDQRADPCWRSECRRGGEGDRGLREQVAKCTGRRSKAATRPRRTTR